MYWYRSKANITVSGFCLLLIFALQACKPDSRETKASLKYFDIKGFFAKDSARLTQLNRPVYKTVRHNNTSESKRMHIANWGVELSLFKASDINKPAWQDSYTIQADSNIIIYQAKYPELTTREIMIKLANRKVKWIVIFNSTKNILYKDIEKLSYFPDSLYLIEKKQSVRLIGTNKYIIKGLLNQ